MCDGPNIPIIVGLAVLSVVFVGYIYWSVGSATISKIAIFVNYLQLLAQSYVVTSIKFLPLAEFNWITMASASGSCIFPFTWTGLWLFIMCIPLCLLLIVLCIFLLRKTYKALHQRIRHSDKTRKCRDAPGKKTVGVNSIQAGVMLILFNYLLIAKTSLSMFACVDIFGQSLNAQNYSFPCGTALHTGLIIMAAAWLAIFCVFVPLVVLLRIVVPHKMPQSVQRLLDVEFLTIHFRDGFKWWEVVFIFRRLVFAIVVTIISVNPNVKVLVFSLFALSFLTAELWFQPYEKLLDNVLEFMGLAAIVVTFTLQSYVLAYGDPNDAILIFVLVLNAIVLTVMGIFVLVDAVPMVYGKIRACLAAKKRKKALKMVAEAAAADRDDQELQVVDSKDIDIRLKALETVANGVGDFAAGQEKFDKTK